MSRDFENKVVIVTGGTTGIGGTAVELFLKAGANVVANYARDEKRAKQFGQSFEIYEKHLLLQQADITQTSEREKLIEACLKRFNRIDILVNNVGISSHLSILELNETETQKIFNINLMAPLALTQLVAKQMIQQKTVGAIINISSFFGHQTSGFSPLYDISKAGLLMLTKSAAKELAGYQIRVNSISPGLIYTERQEARYKNNPEKLAERSNIVPLNRFGTSEEVAQAILYLASDAAAYVTGTDLCIDGGWSCYAPMK